MPQPSIAAYLTGTSETERVHAEHVREQAARFFRLADYIHGLPDSALPLLEAAALLHDIAFDEDPRTHEIRGRERLLREGLEGYGGQKILMIGCLMAFHRRCVRPLKDPVFVSLTPENQRATLKLAALLRVAEGLDHTRTQTVSIRALTETARGLVLLVEGVSGAPSQVNIARANEKAGLWRTVFPIPLRISESLERKRPHPYISAKSGMREAGARVMLFFLRAMLRQEANVRARGGAESIHDMRVATRRIRAAMRVFRSGFAREALAGHLDNLRWIAAALGRVRDEDVFLEWLRSCRIDAPPSQRAVLNRLARHHSEERKRHFAALLKALDSTRYAKFARDFEQFLRESAPPSPEAGPRVARAAPKVIRREWKRLLAFQDALGPKPSIDQLHRLRIQGKRVRYTMEFFAGAYKDCFRATIKLLVRAQDTLGALHDLDVFAARIKEFADSPPGATAKSRQAASRACILFTKTWLDRQKALREDFQMLWRRIASARHRGKVKEILQAIRPHHI